MSAVILPVITKSLNETAQDPTANLVHEISRKLKFLYRHEDGCTSSLLFRQRTALILLNIDSLRYHPYNLNNQRTNKVINAFMKFCSDKVKKLEDGFFSFSLEPELDLKLLKVSLGIICNISPQELVATINALYCLSDESNGMKKHVYETLKTFVSREALLVHQWIEAFEFFDFKKEILQNLILSSMLDNLDIKKFVFTTAFKDKALSILDKYVERKPSYLSDLDNDFVRKFPPQNLSKMLHSYATPDKLDLIPITMQYRTVMDFKHKFNKPGNNDPRVIAAQAMEVAKTNKEHVLAILKVVKIEDETLALALAELFKEYMLEKDLLGLFPRFNLLTNTQILERDREIGKLKEILNINSNERIPYIKRDDFDIILIDTRETFDELCGILQTKNIIAFDVEASYVCQGRTGGQDATLLQIALKNRDELPKIYLLDLHTLKQNDVLTFDEWAVFFEYFFRPKMIRVGFGIKNDLIFLSNAFPFLLQLFEEKKPKFLCVQECVKLIKSDPELTQQVFRGQSPGLSLQGITQALVDYELEKVEQASNWLSRPMDRTKMEYAAQDAYYTLLCYGKIKFGLAVDQWAEMRNKIYKPVEMSKQTTVAPRENPFPTKQKESFEDVVAYIQTVCESFKARKKAEDIIVMLDDPFLRMKPILRRLGLNTWDHREVDSNPAKPAHKKTEDMNRKMETINKFQKEIIPNIVLLTNKKACTPASLLLEGQMVDVHQETDEKSIIEQIIRKASCSIEFSEVYNRCHSCAKTTSHFLMPMEAYRIIFKSFATVKNFTDKILALQDPMEKFIQDFNALEDKKNCSIDGEMLMVVNAEIGVCRFSINERESFALIGEEKSSLGIDKKLFDNVQERNDVKFCYNCKVFF